MVEDVLKALRVFDGRELAMGRACLTMNNLKKHIFNLRNPPFNLLARIATTLEENFTKRWDMMVTDLPYTGALLNPYLKDVLELQENGDAKRALNRVVRKLCAILGVGFNDAMAELTEYEERRGPYSPVEAPDIREAHMEPHQWWHRVGGNALPKIAKRILSLTYSTSSCERNWSMYSFVHNKSRNRLGVDKAEALVYIYTNSKLLRQRLGAYPVHWYDNNILSKDSDPDDNRHETESERNDDGGNDDDGQNLEAFNWDGFLDDGTVGGAYARNRSPTATGDGGVRDIQSLEDYDDVPSGDDGSEDNVRNANDDDRDNNVQNENGEEAPNNAAVGGDVEAAPQGPQNNVPRQPEEVPVEQGREINIPKGQNEIVDQEIAPQLEGATDPEDEMLLDGTLRPCAHRTAPPVGPTLVMLGIAGRNAARRPPQHYTVVWNNRSTQGRIGQSNIPRPRSANNGGMACTEEAKDSSRGNCQASQSNPSVLPFLDTHTLGGSSYTPPLTMRRGPEVSDDDNPSMKRMKRIVQTNVAGTSTVELRNLSLEVEGELQTNYGNEANVEGDDEREDNDGNVREEASND
jgi:hypothetical protein